MNGRVAIVTSLVIICAISILLLGCPPPWSQLDLLKLGWNIMERHPIRRPYGLGVIGGIGEKNGSGFRAIGRGGRGPMLIGSLVVGNQEMGVGSGSKAIGSTDKRLKSRELSAEN